MAELKTKQNEAPVEKFLNSVKDDQKRKDSFRILEIMRQVTKQEARMWGTSIVGFGKYHYRGKSGREGDWFITGFSPRKQNMTLYLVAGVDYFKDSLKQLGKHKTGVGCLYFDKLQDINIKVLKDILKKNFELLTKEKDDSLLL